MRKKTLIFFVIIVSLSSCKFQCVNPKAPPPANSILLNLLVNKAKECYGTEAIWFQKKAIMNSAFHNDVVIGRLYIDLGLYYFQNNEFRESKKNLQIGIELLEKEYDKLRIDDFESLYGALLVIVNNYRLLQNYDSAFFYIKAIEENVGQYFNKYTSDRFNSVLSEIYTWEALLNYEIGEMEMSIALNIEAISLRKKATQPSCIIANNYSQLADIYTLLSDFKKAELYQKQANQIILNCFGDSSYYYAEKNTALGYIYYEAQDYNAALNCFSIAHNIISSIIPKENIQYAYSYNNLGDALCGIGLVTKGISYYNKALKIFEENNLIDETSIVYHNLGNAYFSLNQLEESKGFYGQALTVGKGVRNNNNIHTAYTYQRLGLLHQEEDDLEGAINYLSQSISELSRLQIDTNYYDGRILNNLILSKTELFKSLYYKGICEQSVFLKNRRTIYLESSIESFQHALHLLDEIRNQYNNERAKRELNELGNPLFSKYLYSLLLAKDIRRDESLDNRILEAIERNKYTALRSQLYSMKLPYYYDLPNEIINKTDSLNKRLRILENSNYNHNGESNLTVIDTSFENLIFDITFSLDSLNNYVVLNYPHYYKSLSKFSYCSIQSIQNKLSDLDGVVEYFYNDSVLVILAITKREHKIYSVQPPKDLLKNKTKLIQSVNFSNIDSSIKHAKFLYKQLIKPIERIISNCQNILIIPGNHFSDLPFELLIKQTKNEEERSFQKQHFLLNDFCISYHFSLNLWENKSIMKNFKGDDIWETEFSGFAPMAYNFEPDSNIFKNEVGLPHTKLEVNNIVAVFNNYNKESKSYIGEDSSEEFLIEALKKSRIVHIASHSLTNCRPESYHLIIEHSTTPFKPKIFNPHSINNISYYSHLDGKLFLPEIYNLTVNSELVTISACCSGSGEIYTGEGVISLAQGFYYSGAQNILYTLWDVSDIHTKHFMSKFYNYISLGHSYAMALRNTKLEFINSNYILPKLWSGFLIIN